MTEKDFKDLKSLKNCKRTQKSITPMNLYIETKNSTATKGRNICIIRTIWVLHLYFRLKIYFVYHKMQ